MKSKAIKSASAPLEWTTVRRKVSELNPYEKNPRKASPEQYEKLLESFKRLGYMTTIIAQPDGTIIGGHLRKRALKELKYKEVDIRVPNRQLTPEEFKEALLRDNMNYSDWDEEILMEEFSPELIDLVGVELPDIKLELKEPVEKDRKKVEFSANTKPKTCPHCGELLTKK